MILLGGLLNSCFASQTFSMGELRCVLEAGTLTQMVARDGTVLARATAGAPIGALRRLEGDLVPQDAEATVGAANPPLSVAYRQFIGKGDGRLEMRLSYDDGAREMVVEQSGATGPGLHGVQWGIAGIPLDFDVLVPGCSGQRLTRAAPVSSQQYDYPMTWEAQFVIVQGPGRGFYVWAEDAVGRYKNLRVWKKPGGWDLAFGTQNLAPFEDKASITSVRWRVGTYRGDWRVPARRYRDWAYKAFGLDDPGAQNPAWVKDIRLMVICGMDLGYLDTLAAKLDPRQTILYVPGWRRDGYDRNYPDYTALPELAPFVQKAHQLGFRVMLHVNYFGCDPKNELYSKFEPYQARDPFSKEKLWWTWERADPPIKFAYINPASSAWRELFVSRLKEVADKYAVDAFHLDQTLCLWNHAGGLVDGMTMLEGSLAEHRALRQAMPKVALSGEGLNEITFRYESFAQRHVWGMNHVDGTWMRPWLEAAHPVSSYLLLPHTTINGYLGLTSPTNGQLYAAWREAYQHWGVIPTLAWSGPEVLDTTDGFAGQLMDEARFFLAERLSPDLDGPWEEATIFPYRTASGRRVTYVRDQGVALVAEGPPRREISRTVSGVEEVVGAGAIGGWRAYDESHLFGLHPEAWYPYFADRRRDLKAFHLSAMPRGQLLDSIVLTPELAAVTTDDSSRVSAWVSDLLASARCGYVVFGGEGDEVKGPLYDSPAGASFMPAGRELVTLHPPWKAQVKNPQTGALQQNGTGQVYAVMEVKLPAGGPVRFLSEVHLDPGAVGKSDGVTFTVEATCDGETLRAEVNTARSEPTPLDLDLTKFAGKQITLKLTGDPGPRRDPSFDWARWGAPRIETSAGAPRTLRVVSPQPWAVALTAEGEAPLKAVDATTWEISARLPGSIYLLRDAPRAIAAPCDLTTLPFITSFVSHQGEQLTNPQFAGAGVGEGTVGGVAKRGFNAHPPNYGRTVQDFAVRLPQAPCTFRCSIGLRDGSKSEGCLFRVTVSGKELARQVIKPGAWHELTADLSPYAGRPVLLSLVTEAYPTFNFDWAVWAEPRAE